MVMQTMKEIAVIDLTQSDDDKEDAIENFNVSGDGDHVENSSETCQKQRISSDLILVRCDQCLEYFFNYSDWRCHSDKYHYDTTRLSATEVNVFKEKETSSAEDNGVKTHVKGSQSRSPPVTTNVKSQIVSTCTKTKSNTGTSDFASKDGESDCTAITKFKQVATVSPFSDAERYSDDSSGRLGQVREETSKFCEDPQQDSAKDEKKKRARKKYPHVQDYFVHRAVTQKQFHYNDHLCPYCGRDCGTASRWESHIRNQHENPKKHCATKPAPKRTSDVAVRNFHSPSKINSITNRLSCSKKKRTNLRVQCHFCSKWIKKSAFVHHVRVHTREKVFSSKCCQTTSENIERCGGTKSCSLGRSTRKYNKSKRAITAANSNVFQRKLNCSYAHPNEAVSERKAKSQQLLRTKRHSQQGKKARPQNVTKDGRSHDEMPIDKLYLCEKCDFATFGQSELSIHISTVHDVEENTMDGEDNWEFDEESSLGNSLFSEKSSSDVDLDDGDSDASESSEKNLQEKGSVSNSSEVANPLGVQSYVQDDNVDPIANSPTRSFISSPSPIFAASPTACKEEGFMRENVSVLHSRTLHILISTEEDRSLEKRIFKLAMTVWRKYIMMKKRKRKYRNTRVSQTSAASPRDDSLPRMIVKIQGENIAACSVFRPTREENVYSTAVSATNEPIKCEFCNATFVSHYSYLIHVVYHKGASVNSCDDCGKVFLHSKYFREHMSRVHNILYKLPEKVIPKQPKALVTGLETSALGLSLTDSKSKPLVDIINEDNVGVNHSTNNHLQQDVDMHLTSENANSYADIATGKEVKNVNAAMLYNNFRWLGQGSVYTNIIEQEPPPREAVDNYSSPTEDVIPNEVKSSVVAKPVQEPGSSGNILERIVAIMVEPNIPSLTPSPVFDAEFNFRDYDLPTPILSPDSMLKNRNSPSQGNVDRASLSSSNAASRSTSFEEDFGFTPSDVAMESSADESLAFENDITNLKMLSFISSTARPIELQNSSAEPNVDDQESFASMVEPNSSIDQSKHENNSNNINCFNNSFCKSDSTVMNSSQIAAKTSSGSFAVEKYSVQVPYNVGSRSKMLSRRQCPYCCVNYQSQLALEEHIVKAHTTKSTSFAASQG